MDKYNSSIDMQSNKSKLYKNLINNKNVGMVLYASDNYGSCATNYALCKAVNELGYTPILLDSCVPLQGVSDTYLHKHFDSIGNNLSENKYEDLNELFEKFILGSDYSLNIEVQHTAEYIEYFLMAFADNKKIKIAYAPSLGKPNVENDQCLCYLYKSLLRRFQLVTFRELSAVDLAKRFFGITSYYVLDPVFLVEACTFNNIAKEVKHSEEKPFLLAYILDNNYEKQQLIEKISKTLGLDYKIVFDRVVYKYCSIDMFHNPNIVNNPSFEEWLYLFSRASFVITDSFHGTCFALLFHKQYISLKNRNTLRFDSLAHLLGYGSIPKKVHIYENLQEAINDPEKFRIIDFAQFDRRIAHERARCLELLRKALSTEQSPNLINEKSEEYEARMHYVELWKHSYFHEIRKQEILSSTPFKIIFLQRVKRRIKNIYTKSIIKIIIDFILPKYTRRRQFTKNLLKKFFRFFCESL